MFDELFILGMYLAPVLAGIGIAIGWICKGVESNFVRVSGVLLLLALGGLGGMFGYAGYYMSLPGREVPREIWGPKFVPNDPPAAYLKWICLAGGMAAGMALYLWISRPWTASPGAAAERGAAADPAGGSGLRE